MTDDYYRRVNGVREPDPTLGKGRNKKPAPAEGAAVEPVPGAPSGPKHEQAKPEHHAKPKRQRVILADPRQATSTLRARVELEEQTSWGKLLVRDLVKIQLRTASLLALLVMVTLCSLPVLFYLIPSFGRVVVLGIPLPWLILGVAPFPFLFGIGLWYNRLAERHERDFVDMIEN
ncbi:hypothetical protein [Amycolatopsis sp. BJA-103]|uniref:hypothetical protein n=1 Tax=unclassified Amycolatopsis TaxID=2618356 RepID=UPI000C76819B|nr:hypothetical protein [Amycolatopsis sp. BJA-103]AUI62799.1 hypothetical protein BKN51_34705 [Amycolatopsis sp. BJA-103]PNE18639.1 hypothetical protein B1H26_12395 [Amycolatopsis sp. BJA-103]